MDRRQRTERVRQVLEEGHRSPGVGGGIEGVDDTEWVIDFAARIREPLGAALGTRFDTGRLVSLIVEAGDEHEAVAKDRPWSSFVADLLVERFVPEAHEKLALYFIPGCPFCRRVLATIDRLHLDVELRNIWESHKHRHELLQARGRTTVPVLRCSSDAGERWMPESRDIVAFLERLAAEQPTTA